jgi:predicted nucleotidyltransferase
MNDLESAFEMTREHFLRSYLDLQTGQVLIVAVGEYAEEEDEEKAERIDSDMTRYMVLEGDADFRPSIDDAREFVKSVEDERFRRRLQAALEQRRGAFRQFLDVLHEESGEIERWHHVRRQRLREHIVGWFAQKGIAILHEPLPPYQPRHDVRRHLLAGAVAFTERARKIAGVTRIALIGSICTPKRAPNDVDLLVTMATTDAVPDVAAAGRKLKGHAQTLNRGADVFLSDSANRYLGRTCPWRECAPGIRQRCEAQTCGGHLYDDLHILTLPAPVIATPPLVIWPEPVAHGDLPPDVREAFGLAVTR